MLVTWGQVFSNSLQGIWLGIASFIPKLLGAIIIVLVAWLVGAILYKFVYQLIKLVKLDNALKAAGVEKVVEKGGFKLDSESFLKVVEWFFIIVGLVTAFDALGLKQVTAFLSDVVLGYLPQVFVAVLIILIAAVVAEAAKKVVVGTAQSAGLKSAKLVGQVTVWAIWIFAILLQYAARNCDNFSIILWFYNCSFARCRSRIWSGGQNAQKHNRKDKRSNINRFLKSLKENSSERGLIFLCKNR
jgi:hypothetical protein